MNTYLLSSNLKIARGTAPTIGQLLFNSNNKSSTVVECSTNNCAVFTNDLQNMSGVLKGSVTGTQYKINKSLTCNEGDICVINGVCASQYTGKTIHNGSRCNYHLNTTTATISDHERERDVYNGPENYYSVTFIENYSNRGKYNLSGREMLWNVLVKGIINTQMNLKTLDCLNKLVILPVSYSYESMLFLYFYIFI